MNSLNTLIIIIVICSIFIFYFENNESFVSIDVTNLPICEKKYLTKDGILIIDGKRPNPSNIIIDQNGKIVYNPAVFPKCPPKVKNINSNINNGIPWQYDDVSGVIPTESNNYSSSSDILYGKGVNTYG